MADDIDGILVSEVAGWVESRLEDPGSLEGLSELEADVLGTIAAKGIIGNGGFVYWYEGKDRGATAQVAASFERMGLVAAADAMRRSLVAVPPLGLEGLRAHVAEHRKELETVFGPLDEAIWHADYDLAAARYVFGRRLELLALEPGFAPLLQQFEAADRTRTKRLAEAVSALPSDPRARCERAIAGGDLTLALDQAISAGGEQGAAFWTALAEVARALGHAARADRCDWGSRIAARGALVVAAELVPGGQLPGGGSRVHRTGDEVAWNAGAEPAGRFRAHRAELFIDGRGWAEPGDRREVLLVPGDRSTPTGTEVVLHDRSGIVGRGRVTGRREPRAG